MSERERGRQTERERARETVKKRGVGGGGRSERKGERE